MASVDDVAAAVLARSGPVTTMKLQKLIYYCQAWHLVRTHQALFADRIEAWPQGPVVPSVYRRHRRRYSVSSWDAGNPDLLTASERDTVAWVLGKYGHMSAESLSKLTHIEPPWRIARDTGATPYVALLTVFTALMHRYTGQRDIWIGSATSSRGQAAFQEVLGYFANMMVVRTKLDHGVDFTGLLGQVRDTVLDGMEHQDFPYPMVVRQVADRRDDGSTTLFDVAFHYETAPWQAQRGLSLLGTGFEDAEIELGPVTLRPYEVPTHGSEHDLALFVEEIDGVSYCSLRYAVDLFDRETVVRMAEHLQTLAGSCVAQPTTDIGMLPMLSAAERKQLLDEWNRPDDGIATAGSCAHHVVMAQAERTPDNLAVVCEERSLTYRSLVAEAARLAAFLRSRGVGPEVKVGLFADGSCDLMVGMLGVMMSGGAYVPLDPGYPAKRVSYMLEDSAVALLLTQRHLVSTLSEVDVPKICLDDPIPDVGTVSGDEPNADNLAYIIYTSGSTGRPKGVLVEHRGVVDLDLAHRDGFAPDPDRRILLNSSISFDVSTWEWMMALGTGATLHLESVSSLVVGGLTAVVDNADVLWAENNWLDECLTQTTDTLPLAARAARAYLDVAFFHPFPDGNGRAAMLVLDFVLTRENVGLRLAAPVLMTARYINADDALDL
ncbi:AMP-binding protein, partial [Kibdelosporangium lantanae]